MSAKSVYVKTPKGIEEMNSRIYGLAPKARKVLIMVDGKRDGEEISAMFADVDVSAMLDGLVADGFIGSLNAVGSGQTSVGEVVETVVDQADEPRRLEMAKNLMLNSMRAFIGSMGSELVDQIGNCNSLEQLRPYYPAWRESIAITRDGPSQLGELDKRLAALFT